MPQTPAAGRATLTLDPSDWTSFRELSHQMLDDILGHLEGIREQLAWQEMPAVARTELANEPVPRQAQGEAGPYRQFLEDVLPYSNGNVHPRFFGWVQGCGVPLGVLADMLAAGMNPHLAGLNQAPHVVEAKVIDWMKELMGFPASASGLLLSGGSMANLNALAVARHVKCGFDIREEGLQGRHPLLTIYGSEETHGWAKKAAVVLGFGTKAFRQIDCNPDYTINVLKLREAILKDRAAGCRPIVVLATAGTVNTGATDDLEALADLCQELDLWLHVDGAFGALAALSSKLNHIVKGMERADSLAFDLHKWMCLPFEIACVLVKDDEAHRATFSQSASYLATTDRGVIAGGLPFADRGIELTRGFKALKAWMCMKAYGVDHFAQLIEQSVEQIQYLEKLVKANPDLELMAPVPLNIVCFRYRPSAVPEGRLNAINEEILMRLQERGIAVPSQTTLEGKFAIRACIVNHRTRYEDVDALVDAVVRIGSEMVKETF